MEQTNAKRVNEEEHEGNSVKKQKLETISTETDVTDVSPKTEESAAALDEEYVNPDGDVEAAENTIQRKSLTEKDVGITEYIGKHEGFHAIFKQRFSDFIVNEIDMKGEIVKLTDISKPKTPTKVLVDVGDCLSAENIEKLNEISTKRDKNSSVILEAGDDKAERTKMHQAIRDGFIGLESTTEVINNKKVIKVVLQGSKGRNARGSWPQKRGNYCKFVLYKENKDTMDAINFIANKLRIKPGQFQYSGTKDRRAKTSQLITVFRTTGERLFELNKVLKNICLGNFSYVDECLKLGQLLGNRFIIVLRALLHSNWKEAVELILKPRDGENDDITEARKIWWETRNAKEALSKAPRCHRLERLLLEGLSSQGGNNYANALLFIPRNTRLMYVHSYQSYVWNTMVSQRIKQFGLVPVIGDLVYDKTDVTAVNTDACKEVPHTITADNISKYTIHDIVMPLPGFSILYPDNEAKNWYKEILSKDGLDVDNLRHSNKDYSLPGTYRKMVIKSTGVSWKIYRYNDVKIPLSYSDYELLNGPKEPESIEGGNLKAIRLCITLPPSCYATMAIREIMKTDTSSAYQAKLTEEIADSDDKQATLES
ncbi:pseudouridylate synthase 7 homolog [Octopus vulgaris]|uniref:Pseudouridylate synthase 7 homolog n=1 Tax=Octopus vulgaris TaxID=6645 RepID=A0AA36BFW2_OCTVU|nr:pseudouridylate synthase 7 homolog [Octopus vulgaris]